MGDYVEKAEFNQWKEKVAMIEKASLENQPLLHEIDKKVDIIAEKISSNEEKENLKFKPLEERVEKVEDSQKWLRRTIISSIVALVFEAVGLVIAFLK